MRRDPPTRHGRAADALIASYLRELLLDDGSPADLPGLDSTIPANREGEGAPLGVPTQPTEAGIQCALE
ncbi:MAG: hypothetical protein JSS99_11285 [Actinobacteria bacterium]|nr:hypothetical protein [Actinomycetota bacterium]